jgi:hypothetical protein
MDIVCSKIYNTTFSEYLWSEALKIATHVLNWVISKSVSKIPYELWTDRQS